MKEFAFGSRFKRVFFFFKKKKFLSTVSEPRMMATNDGLRGRKKNLHNWIRIIRFFPNVLC